MVPGATPRNPSEAGSGIAKSRVTLKVAWAL
jgi:hypothetical protein